MFEDYAQPLAEAGGDAKLAWAIAARSDASEADLLQELGLAVAGYLAPFAAADRSPWDLLGEDVALLGSYFSRVRKGTDGEPVDLRRYFWDADRMNVDYDPDGGRMEPRPDRSQDGTGFDLAPRIPPLRQDGRVGRHRMP